MIEHNDPDQQNDLNLNDINIDQALRSFRASVHAWSDHELNARPLRTVLRQPRRSWLSTWMMAPAMGWGLATVLAVAAISVPVGMQHERQVASEQAARQALMQQRQAEAASQAASVVNDEELMSHVNSDIAQTTPDALQPLASLMGDTSAQ